MTAGVMRGIDLTDPDNFAHGFPHALPLRMHRGYGRT
jgi:hypothetical protein